MHRDHLAPRVQHGRRPRVPRHVDVGLQLRVAHQQRPLLVRGRAVLGRRDEHQPRADRHVVEARADGQHLDLAGRVLPLDLEEARVVAEERLGFGRGAVVEEDGVVRGRVVGPRVGHDDEAAVVLGRDEARRARVGADGVAQGDVRRRAHADDAALEAGALLRGPDVGGRARRGGSRSGGGGTSSSRFAAAGSSCSCSSLGVGGGAGAGADGGLGHVDGSAPAAAAAAADRCCCGSARGRVRRSGLVGGKRRRRRGRRSVLLKQRAPAGLAARL